MYLQFTHAVFLFALTVSEPYQPLVKIDYGLIRGEFIHSRNGRGFSAFKGIPYAEPPLGGLRFKPPVPVRSCCNVLNATGVVNQCPQRNLIGKLLGDEDCLYLNVYVPEKANLSDDGELLPVMFFIHGGAHKAWSGIYEEYNPELLMDRDVVLVTINYRLGSLGYLSTGDDVVPGNNGLKDQNLALKWVVKNIRAFGGDPKRITLFGQSSGGLSVQLHMISPLSKGLFQNAISQSGTAGAMFTVAEGSSITTYTKKLAELLNCTRESNVEMVECLREVPAIDIVLAQDKFVIWSNMPLRHFVPVIEPNKPGAFLTQNPIDAYKTGSVAKIPYMIGINTEEGAFYSAGIFSNSKLVEQLNNNFSEIAQNTLAYTRVTQDVEISKKVREFYLRDGEIDDSPESKAAVTKMFSDSWRITTGTDNTAFLHAIFNKQPVFYYVLGYRPSTSFTQILGNSDFNFGVAHCDELQHFFKLSILPAYRPNHSDLMVTELLLDFWTNFAATGDPNGKTPKEKATWKRYFPGESLKMLYIGEGKNVSMIEEPFPERFKFWKELPIRYKGYIEQLE